MVRGFAIRIQCPHAGHGALRQPSPTLARLARDGAGPNAGSGPGSSSPCASTKGHTNVNHLYSVAALTNAAGQVVERYDYDAYGKQTMKSAVGATLAKSSVGWDRGFTGYMTDQETGLLHANARYYSPLVGRFISRDPWRSTTRQEGLQYRPYSADGYPDGYSGYAAYMVPNSVDPTGMCDWNECDVGAACSYLSCMPGRCGWSMVRFGRLRGARQCQCMMDPKFGEKALLAICTCLIVIPFMACPPAAPAAAAAACAAAGAVLLRVQESNEPPSNGGGCRRSCPGPL